MEQLAGKVLYIEDNPVNVELVSMLFHSMPDLELLTAEDAESGLEIADREKPDLILMDLNLPGMSGYDAVKILQSRDDLREVPVIALTAASNDSEIQDGLDAGFFAYLTKPIQFKPLIQAVKQGLSGETA